MADATRKKALRRSDSNVDTGQGPGKAVDEPPPLAFVPAATRDLMESALTAEETAKAKERADYSPVRLLIADVIESTAFAACISAVILFNMYIVIQETDARGAKKEPTDFMKAASATMLAIYSVESCLRIFVARGQFHKNSWNMFDLVLVSTDILGSVMEVIIGEVPSFAIFRLFRVVRVVRLFRSPKNFRELFMMLHGLMAAMKAIMWATVMVSVTLLFWSLVGVEIINPLLEELADAGKLDPNCARCSRAFRSVWDANLTLIQTVLWGEAWGDTAIPLGEEYPLSMMYFLAAFVSVNLGIMNLIVAVIVDRAHQAREEDNLQMLKDKELNFKNAKTALSGVFDRLDTDGSGCLTCDELMEGLVSDPEFAGILHLMDVSPDDLALLFKILDKDGSGELAYHEFSEQLYKMKTHDTHTLLIFVRHQVTSIVEECKAIFDIVSETMDHQMSSRKAGSAPANPSGHISSPFVAPFLEVPELLLASAPADKPSQEFLRNNVSMERTSINIERTSITQDAGKCCCKFGVPTDELARLQDTWLREMRAAIDQAVQAMQGVREQPMPALLDLPVPRLNNRGKIGIALPNTYSKASHTNSRSIPTTSSEVPASFSDRGNGSLANAASADNAAFQDTIAMVVNSPSKKSSATVRSPRIPVAGEPEKRL